MCSRETAHAKTHQAQFAIQAHGGWVQVCLQAQFAIQGLPLPLRKRFRALHRRRRNGAPRGDFPPRVGEVAAGDAKAPSQFVPVSGGLACTQKRWLLW